MVVMKVPRDLVAQLKRTLSRIASRRRGVTPLLGTQLGLFPPSGAVVEESVRSADQNREVILQASRIASGRAQGGKHEAE